MRHASMLCLALLIGGPLVVQGGAAEALAEAMAEAVAAGSIEPAGEGQGNDLALSAPLGPAAPGTPDLDAGTIAGAVGPLVRILPSRADDRGVRPGPERPPIAVPRRLALLGVLRF